MLNTAKVVEKKDLTHDVFELTVRTTKEFNFKAGQFINIKIEDQEKPCFRGYSIASRPNGNIFKLCIKVIVNGRGSNWLYSQKEEDQITFLGPIGKLTFETQVNKPAIIIATGTGIAPFIGIVEEQLEKDPERKIDLIFGVRHEKDVIYRDFFEELEKKYKNFTFKLTLSRPKQNWKGNKGRVTEILQADKFDPKNTDVYACGLKPMLEDVKRILDSKEVPEETIHFEQYD